MDEAASLEIDRPSQPLSSKGANRRPLARKPLPSIVGRDAGGRRPEQHLDIGDRFGVQNFRELILPGLGAGT